MASNTKLGLVLILLILSAFGFIVYKKAEQQKIDIAHIKEAPPPEDERGDRTFGRGGKEPYDTDDRTHREGSSSRAELQAGRHDAPSPENERAHHGERDERHDNPHDEPRHESKMAQADPNKPNQLPQKEELVLDDPHALLPANIRGAAPEKSAFGNKNSIPFDADDGHGHAKSDAHDGLPNRPAPDPSSEARNTASLDVKKRAPRPDGDDFEPFESEPQSQKAAKRLAAKDDFGDPFGGRDDAAPAEGRPQKMPPAERRVAEARDARPAPSPDKGKKTRAFGSRADTFEEDTASTDDRSAPFESEPAPKTEKEDNTFAHDAAPAPRGDRDATREVTGRENRENFIEGADRPWKGHTDHDEHQTADPATDQKLVDAAPPADAPAPADHADLSGQETYVVQAHDNFWSISRKKYGTARYFRLLAQLNADAVPDPHELQPGTSIVAPSKEYLEAHYTEILEGRGVARQVSAEVVAGKAGENCAGKFYRDAEGQPMYRVGRDDTLVHISEEHLGRIARWIQIFELNRDKLSSPNDLHAGMELILPADAHCRELVQTLHENR